MEKVSTINTSRIIATMQMRLLKLPQMMCGKTSLKRFRRLSKRQ